VLAFAAIIMTGGLGWNADFPQAQAEHDEARDIFNILNDQLISELPMLMDLRIRPSILKTIARQTG